MRTKGRAKSKNIEDKRAYFGSPSREISKDKNKTFLQESLIRANQSTKTESYNKFSKPTSPKPKGPNKRSVPGQNLVRYMRKSAKKKK